MNVYFDSETKSSRNIIDVGTMNYLTTPDSDLICIGYRISMRGPTRVWTPSHKYIPQVFREPEKHRFYAFNISFDKMAVDLLGPKYGFKPIPLENCVDVMALCSRYGISSSLEKAVQDLGVRIKKDKIGAVLMKKLTLPPFEYTAEEYKKFLRYCLTDVDAMCEIIEALPSDELSEEEQHYWETTFKINTIGVPIDLYNVRKIYSVINQHINEVSKEIPILTNGEINTINQRDKIIEWAFKKGEYLPDFTKDTIANKLADPNLDPEVRAMLDIRQEIGLSSVKKYKKLLAHCHKNRIYFNLKYYGSHTGREAGRLFQIQNLPKGNLKSSDQIEKEIKELTSVPYKSNRPLDAAKNLVRPMIKAPDNQLLAVFDYSSIEHVLILWVAQEFRALNNIREGGDNYVKFASNFYQIAEHTVTKEQRSFGKTAILGCGYMMGAPRLYDTCQMFGVDASIPECEEAVKLFRDMFSRIVQLWYTLKNSAVNALRYPGEEFSIGCPQGECTFSYIADRNNNPWLALQLPSGRTMYYCKPRINDSGDYGPVFTYLGIHPETKKFTRLDAGPNKIIENIIQALGRDILMDGREKIMKVYSVIASVHDENIVLVPERDYEKSYLHIKQLMEAPPGWCSDIPLSVSGYCEKRYRKD